MVYKSHVDFVRGFHQCAAGKLHRPAPERNYFCKKPITGVDFMPTLHAFINTANSIFKHMALAEA